MLEEALALLHFNRKVDGILSLFRDHVAVACSQDFKKVHTQGSYRIFGWGGGGGGGGGKMLCVLSHTHFFATHTTLMHISAYFTLISDLKLCVLPLNALTYP